MNKKLNLWSSVILLVIILLLKIIECIFDICISNNFYMLLIGILIASFGNYIVAIKQQENNS